jgi:hypothetical protein
MRPTVLTLCICAGLSAGVCAGYLLSKPLAGTLKKNSFALSVLPSNIRAPKYVSVGGTIRSYNAENNTMIIDAVDPYGRTQDSILEIKVDTGSSITDVRRAILSTVTSNALAIGQGVRVSVARTVGTLHTSNVSIVR